MKLTIRAKIIIMFVAALSLTISFMVVQNWNLVSITRRFTSVEKFDSLFNYVLEVRRYEKNYLLSNDRKALARANQYLDRAGTLIGQLAGDIKRVVGVAKFKLN